MLGAGGNRPVLAESGEVISRALALTIVARTTAADVSNPDRLDAIRSALLKEQWATALALWIDETGIAVDVYEEATHVWAESELSLDHTTLELRLAPIFDQ